MESEVIDALGHDLKDVVTQEDIVSSTGAKGIQWTIYKDCSRCDHEEDRVEGKVLHTMTSLLLEEKVYIKAYSQFVGFENIDFEANGGLLEWREAILEENAVYDAEHAISELKADGSYNNGYGKLAEYSKATNGIAAKEYADEVYYRTYLEVAEGVYVYGPLQVYSVQEYCDYMLNGGTKDDKLKTVCAEMLHYGAAAQTQFKYNLDDLANDVNKIPVMAKHPAGAWEVALLDDLAAIPSTSFVQNEEAEKTMASLVLEDAIVMKLTFAYNGDFDEDDGGKVELLVWDGVTGELTLDNVTSINEMQFTEVYDGKREFAGKMHGTPAKEYSNTIYACARFTDKDGVKTYSKVCNYSVETYVKEQLAAIEGIAKWANLEAVCKRLVIYGEAARNYFNK